jgi:hypothetical protein
MARSTQRAYRSAGIAARESPRAIDPPPTQAAEATAVERAALNVRRETG